MSKIEQSAAIQLVNPHIRIIPLTLLGRLIENTKDVDNTFTYEKHRAAIEWELLSCGKSAFFYQEDRVGGRNPYFEHLRNTYRYLNWYTSDPVENPMQTEVPKIVFKTYGKSRVYSGFNWMMNMGFWHKVGSQVSYKNDRILKEKLQNTSIDMLKTFGKVPQPSNHRDGSEESMTFGNSSIGTLFIVSIIALSASAVTHLLDMLRNQKENVRRYVLKLFKFCITVARTSIRLLKQGIYRCGKFVALKI